MYSLLLSFHSVLRWFVLGFLLFSIFLSYRGWINGRKFSVFDNKLRHYTATVAHIQLLVGSGLYFVSPLIHYFFDSFSDAVHQREIRFFGMEHNLTMLLAIVLISVGSARAKRKQSDKEKFRTVAIWYTIALLVILAAVPWPFSPFVSRPYFRF